MIECNRLIKKYRSHFALKEVSFTLKQGVYGLIGENGAGKSTLFKAIIGEERCDQGEILVDGYRPCEGKLKMGYLPQKFDFFHNLTVYESMDYIGILKGIDRKVLKDKVLFWLKQVNLTEQMHKKVRLLSGGMRQRLGIAQAFMGDPDYILLDEPTVGLDPNERLAFRNMVNETGLDKMILIATHIIDDVQATCENVMVLHHGSLLYNGTTQGFIERVDRPVYTAQIERSALPEWNTLLDIISIKLVNKGMEIRFFGANNQRRPENSKRVDCSLEDAYFFATDLFYRKSESAGGGADEVIG
ncbi:MAG: ATP-binding cassette domain-containing protein [Lachnospiraceae bacterium]|jgi:ABC-2 type transport system ATP-binding protein|nr:ATP-binding cassette domain-containing protein [Lachnospiraceae bacterium]